MPSNSDLNLNDTCRSFSDLSIFDENRIDGSSNSINRHPHHHARSGSHSQSSSSHLDSSSSGIQLEQNVAQTRKIKRISKSTRSENFYYHEMQSIILQISALNTSYKGRSLIID